MAKCVSLFCVNIKLLTDTEIFQQTSKYSADAYQCQSNQTSVTRKTLNYSNKTENNMKKHLYIFNVYLRTLKPPRRPIYHTQLAKNTSRVQGVITRHSLSCHVMSRVSRGCRADVARLSAPIVFIAFSRCEGLTL